MEHIPVTSRHENSAAGACETRFCRQVTPVALVGLCILLVPLLIFDHTLFSLMNRFHSPTTDRIWLALTTLGDGLVLTVILGAFLVVNPRVTVLGVTLLLLSGILVQLIKGGFPTIRPAAAFDAVHVIGPLLRSGSFPSGHAASVMAAGLAVAYCSSSRLTSCAVLVLAPVVSLSRVFVGAHFPGDVLGGVILSLALFYFVVRFAWPRWEPRIPFRPRLNNWRFRAAFDLELLGALFVMFVYAPRFADERVPLTLVALGVLAVLAWGRVSAGRATPPV